jgi:hypothetical protein
MEALAAFQRLRADTAPDPQQRGAGCDRRGVGSVERIMGAAVGEGCSNMAHVGEGSPCDEGGNGGGVRSIGDGAGGGVGCCSNRASEGGVLWRGERRRYSTSSLSSSASHCLFTAFFVRLAGGGNGTGEELGSEGSGSKCSGNEGSDSKGSGRGDGDFAHGGGGARSRGGH